MDEHSTLSAQLASRNTKLIIAGFCGAFLIGSWVVENFQGPSPLATFFIWASLAIGALPAIQSSIEKLRQRKFDIDSLMLIGAGLSVYIGSESEGALLLFLFAFSGGLESYALDRTKKAIGSLHELAPQYANLLVNGTAQRVLMSEIAPGVQVLVKAGEKVSVDGTVMEGSSSINEAVITGEHIPRDCRVGDRVFAGTQNLNGRLVVTVERVGVETTIGRIVEFVTSAQKNPARSQRAIDRIGPAYSVIVVTVAALVGVVSYFILPEKSEAFRRAITVLIVASPCALVIATPVAYLAAIAAAARRGVLIKGGVFLEAISRARSVIFDKTGTLTTGQIVLSTIESLGKMNDSEALRYAGTLESSSTHPISQAIVKTLHSRELAPFSITEFESIPGQGSRGVVANRQVWIGKPEAMQLRASNNSHNLSDRISELRHKGFTVSVLVVDEDVALLGFTESVRPSAKECIKQLREQGIKRMEMFTGDHQAVASSLGAMLALDAVHADLVPEEKLKLASEMQQKAGPVLMVGDGVNDAPALAKVDVGIAMGTTGADVTLDAADVVLMNDKLESLAWLHRHSKRTSTIVLQNLSLAIGVISVLSVFAALGRIPLPVAVLGHEGSTVLVALNALRLLRTNKGS